MRNTKILQSDNNIKLTQEKIESFKNIENINTKEFNNVYLTKYDVDKLSNFRDLQFLNFNNKLAELDSATSSSSDVEPLKQESMENIKNLIKLPTMSESKINTEIIKNKEKYWNDFLRKKDTLSYNSENENQEINTVNVIIKEDILNKSDNIFSESFSNINMNTQQFKYLADNINPVFNLINNKINNTLEKNKELIMNKEYIRWNNGELTININNVSELAVNAGNWIYENRDKLKDSSIILGIGVTGGFLYSQVIKAHGKSVDSIVNLDVFKNLSSEHKTEIIELITKNKTSFNKTGGLLVAITLWVVIRTISPYLPLEKSISFNSEEKGLSEIQNILFPIIKKNKNYKWLKILFIIFNLIIFWLLFFKFNINHYIFFKSIKILTILWLISLTLYNLLSALIIINCNNKNKEISIFKFYPKFLKNRLNYLMKIRHYEKVNLFIWLFLNTSLYSFILLLIVILIFSFI